MHSRDPRFLLTPNSMRCWMHSHSPRFPAAAVILREAGEGQCTVRLCPCWQLRNFPFLCRALFAVTLLLMSAFHCIHSRSVQQEAMKKCVWEDFAENPMTFPAAALMFFAMLSLLNSSVHCIPDVQECETLGVSFSLAFSLDRLDIHAAAQIWAAESLVDCGTPQKLWHFIDRHLTLFNFTLCSSSLHAVIPSVYPYGAFSKQCFRVHSSHPLIQILLTSVCIFLPHEQELESLLSIDL